MELRRWWMLPGQIENSYQPNIFHFVGPLENRKNPKQLPKSKNLLEFCKSIFGAGGLEYEFQVC